MLALLEREAVRTALADWHLTRFDSEPLKQLVDLTCGDWLAVAELGPGPRLHFVEFIDHVAARQVLAVIPLEQPLQIFE